MADAEHRIDPGRNGEATVRALGQSVSLSLCSEGDPDPFPERHNAVPQMVA